MRVAQIGNFVPEFSTENELRDAMLRLDWDVEPIQEGSTDIDDLFGILELDELRPDFILWTRTRDLADKWGHATQWQMLRAASKHGVPVIGYHLDRFWGLRRNGREHQIWEEPYFQVDLLVTADGAHDAQWAEAHVNHHWMLPGVSERWCQRGRFREELATDIVFVGSWDGGYHREWKHRAELVAWLQRTYGDRVMFYPKPGQHAVRGLALNDVYWSAKVAVGDSCLVPKADGTPMTNYCSDRVPETLGRGGILLHPVVGGVSDSGGAFSDAGSLFTWRVGEWDALRQSIDALIANEYPFARASGIDYIREHHTYTKRMEELLSVLKARGLV